MDRFESYIQVSQEDLIRQENLGDKHFGSINEELMDLKRMIDEMIDIAETREVPKGLLQNLNKFTGHFVAFAKRIREYTLGKDPNFGDHTSIVNEVQRYYQSALDSSRNEEPKNFLPTYNAFISLSREPHTEAETEYSQLKSEAESLIESVKATENALRSAASKRTVSDYSVIFEHQAKQHSFWRPTLKRKNNEPRTGSAERFFLLGVASLCTLIIALFIVEVPPSDNLSVWIPELITKLFILGILTFAARFAFRQYSVNKHLSTINKHRQNTLDSYRLFLESISDEDKGAKDLLMVEVAKAIFDQGDTGFLGGKSADSGSPSVLELTRLVQRADGA